MPTPKSLSWRLENGSTITFKGVDDDPCRGLSLMTPLVRVDYGLKGMFLLPDVSDIVSDGVWLTVWYERGDAVIVFQMDRVLEIGRVD